MSLDTFVHFGARRCANANAVQIEETRRVQACYLIGLELEGTALRRLARRLALQRDGPLLQRRLALSRGRASGGQRRECILRGRCPVHGVQRCCASLIRTPNACCALCRRSVTLQDNRNCQSPGEENELAPGNGNIVYPA